MLVAWAFLNTGDSLLSCASPLRAVRLSETEAEQGFLEPNEDEENDAKRATRIETELYSFPADYTLELITSKLAKGEISVPPFQRNYVWSKEKASMLIDSFVRRLPVPPVYLFAQKDNTLLIIDGHQRLTTVKRFFEGRWSDSEEFELSLEASNQLNGKKFTDFTTDEQNQLKNWVLRAIVIEPKKEEYRDAMYDIFSRLNTGGVNLMPQEIRNCAFHGTFNESLKTLNRLSDWRSIIGQVDEDARMRDVELILRGIALYHIGLKVGSIDRLEYNPSLKQFLNDFMKEMQNPPKEWLDDIESLFTTTTRIIHSTLGNRPFHLRRSRMNAPTFDSVFVAFARHYDSVPADVARRYAKLKEVQEFKDFTEERPTGAKSVNGRIEIAESALFGD
jgi:hypothetical protein